ncbi:tetratricopeptide repeat protein [Mycobacterium sp.]|uniref:tetratricopeptide repeat protein n=1 Tax=Mycobacterium sp. TaxID=1785 RepID=UPI003C70CE6D
MPVPAGLNRPDMSGAQAQLKDALRASDDDNVQVNAMFLLGWALEFAGETRRSLAWQEKALALATSRGETVYRSYALWELGIRWFQHGRSDRAEQLLQEGLRVAQLINDQRNAAGCLEGSAWIAAQKNNPRGAAVLTGAADALARAVGSVAMPLPQLRDFHDECERRTRKALGYEEFNAARQQ